MAVREWTYEWIEANEIRVGDDISLDGFLCQVRGVYWLPFPGAYQVTGLDRDDRPIESRMLFKHHRIERRVYRRSMLADQDPGADDAYRAAG